MALLPILRHLLLFSANYYLHSTDTDFRQGYTVENLIGKESLMAVIIKTPEEIVKMRVAGRLAAEVLDMIAPLVVKGVTTNELDQICHDYIVNEQQAIPAPLNYHGFPKSICTSVNNVICHGIPSDKVLKDGDIINIE